MLAAMLLCMMPYEASAQLTGRDLESCGDEYFVPENADTYGMLTQRVVICIKDALNQALEAMIIYLYDALKTTIASLMVISVTIFGVQLILGMIRRIPQETFMLAIKIGLIVYVLDHLLELYPALFDITDELMGVVSSSMSSSSFACETPTVDPQYVIWHNLDCLIGGFIGFGGGVTLASGMLGYIVASTVSGQMGVYITFAGAGFILTFLLSIFRGAYLYVSAMVAITFLLALAPLMLPLLLFKYTTDMVKKWVNLLISYTLQPVILIAFLSLSVSIYDTVLYTGEHSLASAIAGRPISSMAEFNAMIDDLREAGVITHDTTFGMSQVMTIGQYTDPAEMVDSSTVRYTHGRGGWLDPRNRKGGSAEFITGQLDLTAHPAIIAEAGEDPVMKAMLAELNMEEVTHALIMALITGLMLTTMLDQISSLSAYIAGRTRVMLADQEMPFEGARDGRSGGIWGAFEGAKTAAMGEAPSGPATAEQMDSVIRKGGEGLALGFLPPSVAGGYGNTKASMESEKQAATAATAQAQTTTGAPATGEAATTGAPAAQQQPAPEQGNWFQRTWNNLFGGGETPPVATGEAPVVAPPAAGGTTPAPTTGTPPTSGTPGTGGQP